jgi:predicted CXXCH cytochrome family protein
LRVVLAGTASLLLLLAIGVACGTVQRTVVSPPSIEGAHYIGNRQCADCHTNIVRVFPASAHGKLNSDDLKFASVTGCESCHGPGSKHAQAGGGRGKFIVNPGKDATVCFDCHLNVHAEFNLPQRHPVIEGRMNCVQCHDPHGHEIMKPAGGLGMARLNESCAKCHREQARPFVFEHEALREGCTSCHNPHGSVNRQLLTERDNNLCLKCHVQMAGPSAQPGELYIGKVNHAQYLNRGTCWSAGCHSAVHGSNVNPLMFY